MAKKKEQKSNSIGKWVFYGILAAATVLIFVFSGSIWGEDSFFKTFDSPNQFLKYALNNGVPNLARTIVIIGIAMTLAIVVSLIAKITFKSKKGQTISKLFVSFLKWIIAITAVFFIISAWGASTTITLASAGILTLIIGLGSQTLVADILAGLFIVFEGDFQVGDIVVIDGWRGEVSEIGIRTTKLLDVGGNIKIISNNEIKSIINQTQELSIAKCYVSICYEDRIEKVEAVIADNLEKIKEKIPDIVEGPFYKGVSELAESSVNLLFIAKCKEPDIYQVQRDLNREIKIMFDDNNINIPFPQLTLHVAKDEEQKDVTKKEIKKAETFNDEQKELSKGMEETNPND